MERGREAREGRVARAFARRYRGVPLASAGAPILRRGFARGNADPSTGHAGAGPTPEASGAVQVLFRLRHPDEVTQSLSGVAPKDGIYVPVAPRPELGAKATLAKSHVCTPYPTDLHESLWRQKPVHAPSPEATASRGLRGRGRAWPRRRTRGRRRWGGRGRCASRARRTGRAAGRCRPPWCRPRRWG